MKTATCHHCGKSYFPGKTICSRKCPVGQSEREKLLANKRLKKREEMTCPICGKTFHKKTPTQLTCSRKCGTLSRKKTITENPSSPKDQWLSMYDKLSSWLKEHPGHFPSGNSKDPGERQLYNWWRNQVSADRQQYLTAQKIKKLQKLVPEFSTISEHGNTWTRYYLKTKGWIDVHGFGKFPSQQDDGRLFLWWRLHQDRGELKAGVRAKLDEIGFPYMDPAQFSSLSEWDSNYLVLILWQDRNYTENPEGGRYPQPDRSAGGAEKILHRWIKDQARLAKNYKLDKTLRQKLEERGCRLYFQHAPESVHEKAWWVNYEDARIWIVENGPYSLPDPTGETKQLCEWFHLQRKYFIHGLLAPDKVEALRRIGFCFDSRLVPKKQVWDAAKRFVDEAIRFRIKYGHLNLDYETDQGFKRAKEFLQSLRTRYLNNRHDPISLYVLGRVEGLSLENSSINLSGDNWERNFNLLLDHIIENSGINLHPRHNLRGWINKQKQAFRKGVLAPQKAALLAEVGIDLFDPIGRMSDRAQKIKDQLN